MMSRQYFARFGVDDERHRMFARDFALRSGEP